MPSWTMQIVVHWPERVLHRLDRWILGQLLEDAIEALVTLGIDVQEAGEPDNPTTRTPRGASDPGDILPRPSVPDSP